MLRSLSIPVKLLSHSQILYYFTRARPKPRQDQLEDVHTLNFKIASVKNIDALLIT